MSHLATSHFSREEACERKCTCSNLALKMQQGHFALYAAITRYGLQHLQQMFIVHDIAFIALPPFHLGYN
jgi:hypothetical protein